MIELAEVIAGASRAARGLALAGLRDRDPDASENTLIARRAEIGLGRELARLSARTSCRIAGRLSPSLPPVPAGRYDQGFGPSAPLACWDVVQQ